jgi:hypothetical protein
MENKVIILKGNTWNMELRREQLRVQLSSCESDYSAASSEVEQDATNEILALIICRSELEVATYMVNPQNIN